MPLATILILIFLLIKNVQIPDCGQIKYNNKDFWSFACLIWQRRKIRSVICGSVNLWFYLIMICLEKST